MTASKSQTASKTFSGVATLIRHLPTGTVFIYQFLNPILTNNGNCHPPNKILSSILISLCGLSCAFSCFTDSYKDKDNKHHYGIATTKGLWTSDDSEKEDNAKYKLRLGDFLHAIVSVLVFGVVTVLDVNSVKCFFPGLVKSENSLMAALPAVVGMVATGVYSLFPSVRHGIGYPADSGDGSEESDGSSYNNCVESTQNLKSSLLSMHPSQTP